MFIFLLEHLDEQMKAFKRFMNLKKTFQLKVKRLNSNHQKTKIDKLIDLTWFYQPLNKNLEEWLEKQQNFTLDIDTTWVVDKIKPEEYFEKSITTRSFFRT